MHSATVFFVQSLMSSVQRLQSSVLLVLSCRRYARVGSMYTGFLLRLTVQNTHICGFELLSGVCDANIACHIANMLFVMLFQNHITPLHIASKWGHVEMVKLLVDSGCNIHSETKVYIRSILF